MRLRARKDTNQAEIAGALEAVGCSVFDASRMGNGFPDLVVGRSGQTYLLEVKADGGKPTPQQLDFIGRWRGGPLSVVRTVEEALRIVGVAAHDKRLAARGGGKHTVRAEQAARIEAVLADVRDGLKRA